MKIIVVKVTRNGEVGYLKSASLFGSRTPVVDNPLDATNYAHAEYRGDLAKDLAMLKIPGAGSCAMSGVSVDSAHVVELDVSWTEVSSREGRPLPGSMLDL